MLLSLLSLLPFCLFLTLGVYLVAREVRLAHATTGRAEITPCAATTTGRPMNLSARQQRHAAQYTTNPNEAARLSGSWG